jgi:hypothetical protein
MRGETVTQVVTTDVLFDPGMFDRRLNRFL